LPTGAQIKTETTNLLSFPPGFHIHEKGKEWNSASAKMSRQAAKLSSKPTSGMNCYKCRPHKDSTLEKIAFGNGDHNAVLRVKTASASREKLKLV
jgi:Cu/Zn superoxide dismutase